MRPRVFGRLEGDLSGAGLTCDRELRVFQPGRRTFLRNGLEGPFESVRSGGGAHASEDGRSMFPEDSSIPLNILHQVWFHHLPAVRDGVVEGHEMERGNRRGVAVSRSTEGRAAPGGGFRTGNLRSSETVDVEVEFLAQLIGIELVKEVLRLVSVVFCREVGEDVVRGNLKAVLDGNLFPAGLALIVEDVDILAVSAGDDSVVRRQGLIEGLDVSVLEK